MEIKRDYYLDQLIRRKGNGFIKVITGIRRSGKSYLLNSIFKKHLLQEGIDESHIIEIAFDKIQYEKYREPHRFYTYLEETIPQDGKPCFLLLDEIQMLNRFDEVLNGVMDHQGIDIYVTGSNAHLLSKDVATEFRGRGDEVHLYPLSFREFMSIYEGEKADGFREYMTYGGLPPVVLAADDSLKTSVLTSLLKETYLRDIMDRHEIRHPAELEELLNVLASSIGSLTNPSRLANTFHSVKKSRISQDTIQSYISYFEDSFLMEKSQRYDVKGKRYIDTPYKYYFSDTGIRNVRLSFRQPEETHLMENIIYNELRARGYQVDVGVVEYNTTDNDGKKIRKQLEVDFVCNKGSRRIYIQSAYALPDEDKRKQEEASLLKIKDSFKKVILVGDNIKPHYSEDGILYAGVYDFLLVPELLENM